MGDGVRRQNFGFWGCLGDGEHARSVLEHGWVSEVQGWQLQFEDRFAFPDAPLAELARTLVLRCCKPGLLHA